LLFAIFLSGWTARRPIKRQVICDNVVFDIIAAQRSSEVLGSAVLNNGMPM
jgi:hypothetical protein